MGLPVAITSDHLPVGPHDVNYVLNTPPPPSQLLPATLFL